MSSTWTATKVFSGGASLASVDMEAYVGQNGNLDFLATKPIVSVYRSAALTFSSGVATTITWDGVTEDANTLHTTTKVLTVPAAYAGLWRIEAAIAYAANSVGTRWIQIKKNGTVVTTIIIGASGGAHSTVVSFSRTLRLAAGDYIEIAAEQDSGGNLAAGTGADTTWATASFESF